jgi:uncharacterized membrane protein YeaQ/YmgE (transglycosylase-associated protein family)
VSIIVFIIVLAVFGLVVGALARLALPGPDPMSIPMTIGLGIAGTFVGGLIFRVLFGTSLGFLGALVGAIVLLYLYRRFVLKRPLTSR